MLRKITIYFLWLWVFLIPWQTRWIIVDPILEGSAWEYGRLSLYAGDILFGIILILSFVFWIKTKKINSFLLWPLVLFALFVGWAWLSLIWASTALVGMYFALRLTQILLIFLIFVILKPKPSTILSSLVIGAAVQGIIAIAQFTLGWTPAFKWFGLASKSAWELGPGVVETISGRWLRAYGSLPHPNILGGYLAAGLLGAIHLLLHVKKSNRWWLWPSLIIISQGLVLSFSRSAWLGFGVSALLLIIFALKDRIVFKKLILLLILVAIIFAFNFAILQDLFLSRLGSVGRLEAISITERETQIEFAMRAIKLHYLGLGVGNYTHWLQRIYPLEPGYIYQPVHSHYLLIWAELGWFGIISFVLSLLLLFRSKIKAKLEHKHAPFIALLVCFLAIGVFDHYFWTSYSGILLFGITFSSILINPQK